MFAKLTVNCAALCTLVLLSNQGTVQACSQENVLPCGDTEKEALEQIQDTQVKRITAYTPAEIIERKNPRYPRQAAKNSKEGWVEISYVIDEQGKVQDPLVIDYEGHSAFKRAAMSAVKNWTFSPAIKDGKPTQQCHQAVRLDFSLAGNTGASARFASQYRQATKALKKNDIDEAESILTQLKDGPYRNRYENAFIGSLETSIAQQLNDHERELASITRTLASAATHRNNAIFKSEYMVYLHQRLFSLEANRGYYAKALSTSEKIKSLGDGEKYYEQIAEQVGKINALIESEKSLAIRTKLKNKRNFFHTLVRNNFSFTSVEGKLETVEVRCDTHREKFTVAENFVWSIPQSWGQCQILVRGGSGTSFTLLEMNQV